MSNYTDLEVLRYIFDNGIISRATIEQCMHMKETDIYLSMHKYAIWQGKDGFWKTKLPSKTGLRLIKRQSKTDLNDILVDYYRMHSDIYAFKARFDIWVERQEICGRTGNTINKYRSDYKRFFEGYLFEKVDVRTCTDEDICSHIRTVLDEKPIKWRALKDIFGYMNGVFNKCLIDRVIQTNPCEFVDLPVFKRFCQDDIFHTSTERTLSNKEIADLREKLHNPKAKNNNQIAAFAIELSLLTGMRVGELAGLMWDDIFVDDGIILIRHSERYDRIAKKYYVATTKTGKTRTFPITNDILQLLQEIQQYESERGWLTEYVFSGKNGKIHTNAISSSIRNRTMSEQFSGPKSIHAVRRTFNSNLRCMGVSPTIAAALLGHTERVNEQNYTYDISSLNIKREYVSRASNPSNQTVLL